MIILISFFFSLSSTENVYVHIDTYLSITKHFVCSFLKFFYSVPDTDLALRSKVIWCCVNDIQPIRIFWRIKIKPPNTWNRVKTWKILQIWATFLCKQTKSKFCVSISLISFHLLLVWYIMMHLSFFCFFCLQSVCGPSSLCQRKNSCSQSKEEAPELNHCGIDLEKDSGEILSYHLQIL